MPQFYNIVLSKICVKTIYCAPCNCYIVHCVTVILCTV
jgi:hypothetical protein